MGFRLHIIKKRTAPLAWVLAALLLLFPISQHALPGFLLCIESDGTVEIENARSGDCAPALAQVREMHRGAVAEVTSTEREESCVSCLDLFLFSSPADGQAASRVKATPQVQVNIAAFANRALAEMRDDRRTADRFPEKSLPPPSLAPLRSVVLLI